MITATPLPRQTSRWQRELAQGYSRIDELLEALELDRRALADAGLGVADLEPAFAMRVPRAFAARMRRRDPCDPLLRQVLPLRAESRAAAEFVADPLGETTREPDGARGLLRKYASRALLVTTGACAVHCRYCFRREYPYAKQALAESGRSAALEAIAGDASIREVILSGGDPLTLTDARLERLTRQLADIAHVETLRVHTRLPIVLPSRVDAGLLDWIGSLRLPLTIVLHSNHAREIDGEVSRAVRELRAAGAVLLNQSVLLAGVNDSVEALEALSRALHREGVLPYYLHLLDRVRGSAHFEIDETRARALIEQLAARVPGFLVPRLAREVPGKAAKIVLAAGLWS